MVPGIKTDDREGSVPAPQNDYSSTRHSQDEINDRRDLIIQQAIKKSQYIDNEAMKRADSLIEGAYKKCQAIMMDAEKKGFADGYARGLAEGEKAANLKAQTGLAELSALVSGMHAERSAAIVREEQDLLKIAFEIAHKVMRKQAEMDEDAILGILEEVISENQEELKIYLSGYNKTLDLHVDKNIAKRIKMLSKNAKVVIVSGEDVILAETQQGTTDLGIKVQLQQLEEALGIEE